MSASERQALAALIAAEMAFYRQKRRAADNAGAWAALERAHILSQAYLVPHFASHGHMLRFALALRDWREATGQILRLALVPLGSLTGRLPAGNTGRARVSAFKPMPVPPDLAALVSRRDR